MQKLDEEPELSVAPTTAPSLSPEQEKYKSYQLRALVRKSLTIQSRQYCTNCCQIFTPMCCLFLIWLLKYVVVNYAEPLMSEPTQLASFPRLLNPPFIPNYELYEFLGIPMRDCEQWYLFDMDEKDPTLPERIG
jgi:hypothetical protein